MTLLVRNEEETIETNLDYHLAQGVDFVLVTDHDSSDGTRDLLKPYVAAGVVDVTYVEGDDAHHQSERVTQMARRAAIEHGADWVFHNDADEFWFPLSGRLCDVFAAIPTCYGQIVVPRRNFLPPIDGSEPFYSRMIYREAESRNPSGHPLEPKVAHRAHPNVIMNPGNHSLSGAPLQIAPMAGVLEILHFPMRTYDQFERKVLQIGRGYELVADRAPATGRDQLLLLEIQRAGALREFWDDAQPDEPALAKGLAEGSIVCDRRLRDFMHHLKEGAPCVAPDGAATRTVITTMLSAMTERDAALEALEHADAERKELIALRSEADRARAEIQAARADLYAAREELGAVRASKLMRWTRAARRLWYRLR